MSGLLVACTVTVGDDGAEGGTEGDSAVEQNSGEETSGVTAETAEFHRNAVGALLDAQVAAWNRGDVAAFMGGYWNSPELRFASTGSVTRGWQVVLDRYIARYPDRAAMGTLRFEEREIEILGPDSALAFGRWIVERDQGRLHGLFTLVLRRFNGDVAGDGYGAAHGWRIVADHTSSAED